MRYDGVVKSSFIHTREECESKRAYVFRCLIFSLSGMSCCFCFDILPLGPEKW